MTHDNINKPTIAVFFDTAWSEADWILPVLYKIKELEPGWKITVFFSDRWDESQKTRNFDKIIYSELIKIIDHFEHLNYKKITIPWLKPRDDIKIILMDFNNYKKIIEFCDKIFPNAKRIVYPHGTLWFCSQKNNHPRNMNLWRKVHYKHDIELANFSFNTRYEVMSDAKYCVVGTPRYDIWWIERLLKQKELLESEEYRCSKAKARVFAFFTRPQDIYFSKDIYKYIMKSVISIIKQNEQNFLIIKPHPREDISVISKYFSDCNPDQFIISSLHPIQISALSDFVISVWSSAILDALSVNKPVVEFFRYRGNISPYYMIDKKGDIQSIYRLWGLAQAVDSKDELEYYINSFFDNSISDIWKKQQNKFKELYPRNMNSSELAAKVILNTVKPNFYKDLPSIMQAKTPIQGNSSLFLKIDENKNKSWHLQLKIIAANAMPISNVFINELFSFFNADVFIATGTFNEHLLDEIAKYVKEVHSIEQSADLYQTAFMKEIKRNNNITVYQSANILKCLLKDLKGRILFFLSTHDNAGSTIRSKTNLPVIEELRIIKEFGIFNNYFPVILINNIKYFQHYTFYPHELNPVYFPEGERKYPFIQEAFDIIYSISPLYKCLIIGDVAIAYPQNDSITVSFSLEAYTRLISYNGTNYDDFEMINAIKHIAYNLSNEEKSAIFFISKSISIYEDFRVKTIHFLIEGIIFCGQKDYSSASKSFHQLFYYGYSLRFLKKYIELTIKSKEFVIAKMILSPIKKNPKLIERDKNFSKDIENFLRQSNYE